MCDDYCLDLGKEYLTSDLITGKEILEIGSFNVNGSVKDVVMPMKPQKYIGIDMKNGPYVDKICAAENVFDFFEESSFDVVICTEVLEHVHQWQLVVSNMKKLVKTNGIIFITTRAIGFHYHPFPYDFWRYEPENFQHIFSDMNIIETKRLPSNGVCAIVRKPEKFQEIDLMDYELYSIENGKKMKFPLW